MECKICGKNFESERSLSGHMSSHNRGESYREKRKTERSENRRRRSIEKIKICIFCEKSFESGFALGGHMVKCKKNPNYEKIQNNISKSLTGKIQTKERRDLHKISMRKAVENHPESYLNSNVNGRIKKVYYKGIILDSSWELFFVEWCDINEIKWERNKKGFKYFWKGERIYYPDFYLSELDLYVEIKGYIREKDIEKWKAVPNLRILKKDQIDLIKKNQFTL